MIEREAAHQDLQRDRWEPRGPRAGWCACRRDGFYEVTLESAGKNYTTLLPIQSTVILAAEPEEEVAAIEVER